MNFSRIFNQRQNYQLVYIYIALILTEKLNGKSKINYLKFSIKHQFHLYLNAIYLKIL